MISEELTGAEAIEAASVVGREFRLHFAPLIQQWIDTRVANGTDVRVVMMGLSAEALMMSSCAHLGGDALFLRMAQKAIEATKDINNNVLALH